MLYFRRRRPLTPVQALQRDIAELRNLDKGGSIALADAVIEHKGGPAEVTAQLEEIVRDWHVMLRAAGIPDFVDLLDQAGISSLLLASMGSDSPAAVSACQPTVPTEADRSPSRSSRTHRPSFDGFTMLADVINYDTRHKSASAGDRVAGVTRGGDGPNCIQADIRDSCYSWPQRDGVDGDSGIHPSEEPAR